MPNPLWLAAKYGGFNDLNNNGRPDPGEWERDPANPEKGPKTYFHVANMTELPEQLDQAFQAIARGSSTGTATSASVNSILGGGISIQTLYYPEYSAQGQNKVKWLGSVYGLFVDKWGHLREDSDQDGRLTPVNCPRPNNGCQGGPVGDLVVKMDDQGGRPVIDLYYDERGDGKSLTLHKTLDEPYNHQQLRPVWNTSRWLAELDDNSLVSGSRAWATPAAHGQGRRRIYYGHPEVTALDPRSGAHLEKTRLQLFQPAAAKELTPLLLHDNYAQVLPGAGSRTDTAAALIKYIIGQDGPNQTPKVEGWRNRSLPNPWPAPATAAVTWRLGDIINSKPIIAGAATFHYDLRYGDRSYYAFKKKVAARRQVAYFGANDGMLHAINLGFYGSLKDGQVGYAQTDESGRAVRHEKGAELWAYIPTAVLPHLQWLAAPDYLHSYYVDLKPLVADVKIYPESGRPEDPDYESGWRTILIGGLRLGGRTIESPGGTKIPPYSYAEVFALDVTDPEKEPELLWRYSSGRLGLNVGLPTVVTSQGRWYVVLASGPTNDLGGAPAVVNADSAYDGYSNQRARLIVLDAKTGREVVDTSASGRGDYLTVPAGDGRSFFNDAFLPVAPGGTTPWHHQTVYYGLTVSREFYKVTEKGNAKTAGKDRGAVYRLQMVDEATGAPLKVEDWKLKRLLDTDRPVTGAVNSAYDGQGNLWVLFGTGRLWGPQDMEPCQGLDASGCEDNYVQYLYGVKEELNDRRLTFADRTAEAGRLLDVSGGRVYADGRVTGLADFHGLDQGSPGQAPYSLLAAALGRDRFIGYKRAAETARVFGGPPPHDHEMSLTQPKINGLANGQSSLAFTTYVPARGGVCSDDSKSYLHLVDTFT
ncbi:MAG: hypothetical protein LBV21_03560, partial [Candidatus Adiutrix sp.]|nr:hypothetical protein [Candidatus Adiutrix sp.]